MTQASDTYYVATPQRDLPQPHVTSIEGECLQCHDKVWIHVLMAGIARQAKGIICVDCVQELTNKSLPEIVKENVDHMTEILDREINRMKGKL